MFALLTPDTANEALDVVTLSFEYARDLSQHLITLATGTIAVSITFMKEILNGTADRKILLWLKLSWTFFLLSILFGIVTQMAITGNLDHYQEFLKCLNKEPLAMAGNVKGPSSLQIITFLLGVGSIVAFGIRSFSRINEKKEEGALDAGVAKD